jgi:hypothetical protein
MGAKFMEIIKFIIENIENFSLFDIIILFIISGIILFGLYKIFKDIYKLLIETQKETINIKNEIIDLYKEQTNILLHHKELMSEENNKLLKNLSNIQIQYEGLNIKSQEINEENNKLKEIIEHMYFIILSFNLVITISDCLFAINRKINIYRKIRNIQKIKKEFNSVSFELLINKYHEYLYNKINDIYNNTISIDNDNINININNINEDISELLKMTDIKDNEINLLNTELDLLLDKYFNK